MLSKLYDKSVMPAEPLHFLNMIAIEILHLVVVVVDPTPPTCCQQSPAPESCGSQQSLPPGGKERLHFVGIRPEVQARKGGGRDLHSNKWEEV